MGAGRRLMPLSWSAFLLIGWAGLLVPSLARQVEARFGVDDAALGVLYLVSSVAYAGASFGGAFLTGRFGRRRVLGVAAVLVVVALALQATAGSWALFLLAAPVYGLGAGAIDGGLNGLTLAVATSGRARALNVLHLFFSIGAFASPFIVGRLVSAGLAWQAILAGTAVLAAPIGLAFALMAMPSGRLADASAPRAPSAPTAPTTGAGAGPGRRGLLLLGFAITCYVAGEVGVSDWLVRFLARADLDTSTLALSGFWAGLALGRLVSAVVADRLPHAAFAAAAAVASGLAIVVAVVSPTLELSIVAFAIAGFASGPIFPLIVAIGGDLYPRRLTQTAGALTGFGVIGGTIYPPLVGLMSASVGLGIGLVGAAALSIAAGGAVLLAARIGRS